MTSDAARCGEAFAGPARRARDSFPGLAAWIIIANLSLGACVIAGGRAPTGSVLPPPSAALRLDPNTASRAELTLLPGIGPKLADAIIQYRETSSRKPAFRNPRDLDLVPRIGPVILERARGMLRFPADGDQPETLE